MILRVPPGVRPVKMPSFRFAERRPPPQPAGRRSAGPQDLGFLVAPASSVAFAGLVVLAQHTVWAAFTPEWMSC